MNVDKLVEALQEVDAVVDNMLNEGSWPPERLAPRLVRLQLIVRAALAQRKEE